MADHGEVQYTTADGNDYREHEATYVRFLDLAFSLSCYVIAIVIGLAIVGATHSTLMGVGVILLATLLAIPALVTGGKGWSYATVAIALFALAAATVG
jgi:aa3 type cytochrome c oxidase subunit IV